ncbi:MAG: tetratricopeptide repeat protein [Methanotrichaceae archaeon]|nr:tetratricopeptide repeat protein [Methanotrichaceae archaeon]
MNTVLVSIAVLMFVVPINGQHEFVEIGDSLALKGHYTEAIRAYDKAIQQDPQFAEAWYNKGIVFEALGQTTEAETAFVIAIRLDPSFAEIYQNIERSATGLAIDQTAQNLASATGWNNRINQGINQQAVGGGITQTAGNMADVSGYNNRVNQQINQRATGGGITQSGGNSVIASGSRNDVLIREIN